jgi:hypothetical protein
MLIDANLLLFAVDSTSPFHAASASWLTRELIGSRRVGLPWQVIGGFLRIITNPRASSRPLSPEDAWGYVDTWLGLDVVWIPQPTERHAQVLGSLITSHQLRANLIPDAQLAALAVEHGLALYSADTDFARFTEIRWENPLEA